MQLSDHSLRQIDEAYLKRLGDEALRSLSSKLLLDLKEARERLNQTSRNSSLPPSREAPWDKTRAADAGTERDEGTEETDAEDIPPETAADAGGEAEAAADAEAEPAPAVEAQPMARKRAGKVPGSPGHGRPAPDRVDAVEIHRPEACAGCEASLAGQTGQAYTGYYEVDWVREGSGWAVRITKHLFEETVCGCGHATRAEPFRGTGDAVDIGGFRLVGAGLATLMVALSKRYGMSRARIQEFLHDWLDIWISTGAIHEALAEAAAIVAPLERELVRNLLEDYAGVLMSDGWQAYRWLGRRLRCWAHLKRKAQGLADSLGSCRPRLRTGGPGVVGRPLEGRPKGPRRPSRRVTAPRMGGSPGGVPPPLRGDAGASPCQDACARGRIPERLGGDLCRPLEPVLAVDQQRGRTRLAALGDPAANQPRHPHAPGVASLRLAGQCHRHLPPARPFPLGILANRHNPSASGIGSLAIAGVGEVNEYNVAYKLLAIILICWIAWVLPTLC